MFKSKKIQIHVSYLTGADNKILGSLWPNLHLIDGKYQYPHIVMFCGLSNLT